MARTRYDTSDSSTEYDEASDAPRPSSGPRASGRVSPTVLVLAALLVLVLAGTLGATSLFDKNPVDSSNPAILGSANSDAASEAAPTAMIRATDSMETAEEPSANPSNLSTKPATASPADPTSKSPSAGSLKLVRSHEGESFLDGWEFFHLPDPTEGQVNYLDEQAAQKAQLFSAGNDVLILRVDNTTKLTKGANRDSVRIETRTPIPLGSLIVADILHMPTGCATWPAWWSFGDPDWPQGGEIDVIEGVNLDKENVITLHTDGDGCKPADEPKVSGEVMPENVICDVASGNGGCSYGAGEKSYGAAFNDAGGGVYATVFAEEGISVWFWTRSSIPSDVLEGTPDPTTWSTPTANWPSSSCNISKFFTSQRLIFNCTICGEYAGDPESWARGCKDKAPTCSDHVMEPSNFDDAYWAVKSVKVYAM